jgi:hypothetical protein
VEILVADGVNVLSLYHGSKFNYNLHPASIVGLTVRRSAFC